MNPGLPSVAIEKKLAGADHDYTSQIVLEPASDKSNSGSESNIISC